MIAALSRKQGPYATNPRDTQRREAVVYKRALNSFSILPLCISPIEDVLSPPSVCALTPGSRRSLVSLTTGGADLITIIIMKWLIPLCLCGLPLAAPAQTFEEKAVAAVLMAEAWSEGMPGMTAVAEVIHQRAVEKAQAPLQVVSATRGQFHAFSCLNGTTLERLVGRFARDTGLSTSLATGADSLSNTGAVTRSGQVRQSLHPRHRTSLLVQRQTTGGRDRPARLLQVEAVLKY